jgi:hypothetical protein
MRSEYRLVGLLEWPAGRKRQGFYFSISRTGAYFVLRLIVYAINTQVFNRSILHFQGDEKYITFTVDRGGWNNVRMSMEIIFVIAAVTGRTLVLPPKEPLYRLRVSVCVEVVLERMTWRIH